VQVEVVRLGRERTQNSSLGRVGVAVVWVTARPRDEEPVIGQRRQALLKPLLSMKITHEQIQADEDNEAQEERPLNDHTLL